MIESTLSEETRDALADQLQPMLVDLVDLQLVGKQLHWTVVGPTFRSLHELLDEFVEQYRQWGDDVAERMTAVGVVPDGRLTAAAEATALQPVADGWVGAEMVIGALETRLRDVVQRTRERLEQVGKLDLASQDVLIGITGGLEEQLWMVSAHKRP